MGWELIGGDPAPGFPEAVGAAADGFGRVALLARETREGLVRDVAQLGIGRWKGTAADAFRADVAELPDRLHEVDESYETASRALHAFRIQLEQEQDKARAARLAAEQADSDRRAAQQRLDAARLNADALRGQRRSAGLQLTKLQTQQALTIEPTQRAGLNASVTSARSRVARLDADVRAADQTVARHEAAVREAEARLRQAQADAGRIRERMQVFVDGAVGALKQAEKYGNLPNFWERFSADTRELLVTYGPEVIKGLDLGQDLFHLASLVFPAGAPVFEAAALILGTLALVASLAVYASQPGGITPRNWLDLGTRTLGVAAGAAGRLAQQGTKAGRAWKWTERVLADSQDVGQLVEQGVDRGPQGFFFAAGSYVVGKGFAAGLSKAQMAISAHRNANPVVREQLIEQSRQVRLLADHPTKQTLIIISPDDALTRQSLLGHGHYQPGQFLPGNHGASGSQAVYDHALPDRTLQHNLADSFDPGVSSGVERARDWAMEQIPAMDPPDPGPEIDIDLNPSPYGGGR